MNLNTEQLFEQYFNELEGYTLRAERFYDDVEVPDVKLRAKLMRKWLEAAFDMGYECAIKSKES
jgi:hypothetical protein